MKASLREHCAWIAAIGVMALPTQVWANSSATALFNQAVLDYKNGHYLVAQSRFFQVLARDPAQTQCEKYLLQIPRLQGMQMLQEHRFVEAENYLRESYSLQPGNAEIRKTLVELPFKIGKEQYEEGDSAAALANFQRYEKVQPRDALTHYYIANCLARTGYLDAARGEYQQSISLSPASTTASYASAAIQAIHSGNNAAITAAAAPGFGGLSASATPAMIPTGGIAFGASGPGAAPSLQLNFAASSTMYSKAVRKANRKALHNAPFLNANAAAAYAPPVAYTAPAAPWLNTASPAGTVTPAINNATPTATPYAVAGTLPINAVAPNGLVPVPVPVPVAATNPFAAPTNGLTAATISLPPVAPITPIENPNSADPLVRQAVNSIRNQGLIDQSNAAKISQSWQQNSAAQQAMDTAQINATYAGYNSLYRTKQNAAGLTAEQQARLDAANNVAALKTFESQSWEANRANSVNDAANNAQDLLADPKSGLKAIGTDLYTRYYGAEPGKAVPEAHASVARIQANGAGQKYPEFSVDDDVLTMRKAPKRDVAGQVLP